MTAEAASVSGIDVRTLSAELFRGCRTRKITVEEAIGSDPRAAGLSARDRGLLASILLTAYRHLGEIESVLRTLVSKPLPRKSGTAHDILVLGVAQLLFLEIPAHAVIDQSVRAAKADRNALHFSGLINAVLRKVAAAGKNLLSGLDAPRLNTPDWLWERWSKSYGADTAGRIAAAHGKRPALDLSLKDGEGAGSAVPEGIMLPNGQIRLPAEHSPVPEIGGFREGHWWVQDAAATIPVHLLGDISGKSVLDLCAAPGGKTLQMAARGAHVTAVDISEARLRRLRDNLARTRLSAEVVAGDILSPELKGAWDAVLLDAPCSATGTIRRHPELPYLREESQIAELTRLQRQMLRKAESLVKPGGLLVYCTCSLEPEEGEGQIAWLQRWNSDFEVVPPALPWLPAGALGAGGTVRTLPFMRLGESEGLDGFFAVALRRKG